MMPGTIMPEKISRLVCLCHLHTLSYDLIFLAAWHKTEEKKLGEEQSKYHFTLSHYVPLLLPLLNIISRVGI